MSNRILSVGSKFPEFSKLATVSIERGREFSTLSNSVYAGKWMVMFWWPKDFTLICPTEIAEFNRNFEEFRERDTVLLGASTDSEYAHLAWRKHHEDLRDLKFPMIADINKSLAAELGILTEEGVAYRTTYIVDPNGIVRWVCVNDLDVARNVKEVIRTLDAFQSGEPCPCNWEKGETIMAV